MGRRWRERRRRDRFVAEHYATNGVVDWAGGIGGSGGWGGNGGSSVGAGLSPADACNQTVAVICERTSSCGGPQALDCTKGLQNVNCDATRGACAPGQVYHPDQAQKCIDNFRAESCTDFGNGLEPTACGLVCTSGGGGIGGGVAHGGNGGYGGSLGYGGYAGNLGYGGYADNLGYGGYAGNFGYGGNLGWGGYAGNLGYGGDGGNGLEFQKR